MSDTITAMLDMIGDRPIAFHPAYARVTGSIQAGVLLSQAMYWSSRTSDPDGWFWKTQEEWTEETTLTRREQETARKKLVALGIMEEKREGIPAKLYFRVNRERLAQVLTGVHEPMTLAQVLDIYRPVLNGLSRAGHMRARRAGVRADLVDYAEVLSRDGMRCGICGQAIRYGPGQRDEALAFDHITPIARGGAHVEDNLQPVHASCNGSFGQADKDVCGQADKDAYTKQTGMLTPSNLVGLRQADIHTEITTETTPESTAENMAEQARPRSTSATRAQSLIQETDDPNFDRWWMIYPRRVKKDRAKKAWADLAPDNDLANTIIDATERQVAADHFNGVEYAPHPSTWLNDRRWEDEVIVKNRTSPSGVDKSWKDEVAAEWAALEAGGGDPDPYDAIEVEYYDRDREVDD